ncbi:F0F1 ATP synthase subunit delta [Piscinibacter sakaiensis]|uniref:F0F1 ATP synthase subunit delta n=1 Tax=Piscinibacter sakaiensis TaxID=1547922 RepID=UPI003AAE5FC5
MAEIATIARPYAEAYFKVVGEGDLNQAADELKAVAAVAADPQVLQLADSPNSTVEQIQELIVSVVKRPLSYSTTNLLKAMIDNGRLSALPEVAEQFQALANQRSGVSDAVVYSAFEMDDSQLGEVLSALERSFGRKLRGRVEIEPELIGGIRVVVGDEVLDTSIKARLQQMKMALTA